MTEMEMMMTFMGIGFAALGTIILYLSSVMMSEIKLLREEVRDIDRRLCRLEGAFSNKDCCILRHDHKEKAQ